MYIQAASAQPSIIAAKYRTSGVVIISFSYFRIVILFFITGVLHEETENSGHAHADLRDVLHHGFRKVDADQGEHGGE